MKIKFILWFLAGSILAGCGQDAEPPVKFADRVFIGQHIVTMDGTKPTGVAVQNDRISFVGSEAGARSLIGPKTDVIELGKKALLPGFIDAHGHFSAFAYRLESLDLSSPPVGEISGIEDIVAALRNWIEVKQIPVGERVTGFGYDDSLLLEQRHPTREDLDKAFISHPIVIRHVSGHLLVANSYAMQEAGVSALTADPAGGVIRRALNNEPDGVMEETAMGLFATANDMPDEEQRRKLRREALAIYASYGVTTIQDSNVSPQYFSQLVEEAQQNPFPQDIVAYLWVNGLDDTQVDELQQTDYVGGIRIGGAKFTLDGSPQGRTAWLTQPYTEGPPGLPADYVAYPSYDPELYKARLKILFEHNVPVLAHANGDAAIDLMLDGLADALAEAPEKDHRSVAIHAQLMRPDQLPRVKQLGVIPSYYSVHPFFWGDWHRLSFGEQRAAYISPVADTLAMGIPVTIHNDTPVVPPDMMRLVGITVNRETRSGYVLGPDQRATVEQALYAITQAAAYQYFEEDEKGSITPGKRADLVILEYDPFSVDPAELAELRVMATYAKGELVYQR